MKEPKQKRLTRRSFLHKTSLITATTFGLPILIPHIVFGANAPSERITIGCIGTGRMGQGDMRSMLGFRQAQIVAVCDVDANRARDAQQLVVSRYSQNKEVPFKGCDTYEDFRDLIAREDIDAVMICTPDHWHAIPAIAAARAGKDIFLQKPLTLTIQEGRVLSNTARRYGSIFQVGSQQRSDERFRLACELVRNGRIGKVQAVHVGFGYDPGCGQEPEMPVPPNLNYNFWLGQAPEKPYTENRVHPQKGYGRPGWLRILDYGHGMITGWGAHHLDIVQWGLGVTDSGPTQVECREVEFPKEGLWDVHGKFMLEYQYANGVRMTCADNTQNKQGVLFEGTEGWVYVKRGQIDASPKSLLEEKIGSNEIHLYKSNNHFGNWLDCIRTRSETVAPVEEGHRSCTVCLLGSIAMQVRRKLSWDPKQERITNDSDANTMCKRTQRPPWRV